MSTYEDLYPPEGGPFKIGDHLIRETMDRTEPHMVVSLDFGAFRRVWELVEAEAKRHFPTYESMSTARAELRAVEAFRKSWGAFAGSPIDTTSREVEKPAEAPQRRQFKRRGAEPEPEVPAKRKLKRRPVSG